MRTMWKGDFKKKMSKGQGHSEGMPRMASKHSHYIYKKRCQEIGCKRRAKYFIDNKYLCKEHAR